MVLQGNFSFSCKPSFEGVSLKVSKTKEEFAVSICVKERKEGSLGYNQVETDHLLQALVLPKISYG